MTTLELFVYDLVQSVVEREEKERGLRAIESGLLLAVFDLLTWNKKKMTYMGHFWYTFSGLHRIGSCSQKKIYSHLGWVLDVLYCWVWVE